MFSLLLSVLLQALLILPSTQAKNNFCTYELDGYRYDLSKLSGKIITHDNYYNHIDWTYEYSPCHNNIDIRTFKGMAKQINEVNGFAYILAEFEEDMPIEVSRIYTNINEDTPFDTNDVWIGGNDGETVQIEGFMLTWENGDGCGDNGSPRIFNVEYICSNDKYYNKRKITLIESPSCTYTMTLHTKWACKKYAKKLKHYKKESFSGSSGVSSNSGSGSGNSGGDISEIDSWDSWDSWDTYYYYKRKWSPMTVVFFVLLFGFVLYMIIRFIINVKNDPNNDWTDINNIPHLELWMAIKDIINGTVNFIIDIVSGRDRRERVPLLNQDEAQELNSQSRPITKDREFSDDSAVSMGVSNIQQHGVDRVIGVQEL